MKRIYSLAKIFAVGESCYVESGAVPILVSSCEISIGDKLKALGEILKEYLLFRRWNKMGR